MTDLLPGDYVRVRLGKGPWSGKRGVVTYASDAHGEDRVYDVAFEELPGTTFVATEVVEIPDKDSSSAVSGDRPPARSVDNEAY